MHYLKMLIMCMSAILATSIAIAMSEQDSGYEQCAQGEVAEEESDDEAKLAERLIRKLNPDGGCGCIITFFDTDAKCRNACRQCIIQ